MSWVHNSEQGKRATDANVNVSFVACVLSFCLWIGCQSLAHIQNQFNNITIQILCFTYLRTICVYIYIYTVYIYITATVSLVEVCIRPTQADESVLTSEFVDMTLGRRSSFATHGRTCY